MKILITGTSSGIGKALKKELQEFEIIEVCRRCEYSIDLNNIQEVKKLKTKVKLLESQIEKLSKEVKTDFLTKISNKKVLNSNTLKKVNSNSNRQIASSPTTVTPYQTNKNNSDQVWEHF